MSGKSWGILRNQHFRNLNDYNSCQRGGSQFKQKIKTWKLVNTLTLNKYNHIRIF